MILKLLFLLFDSKGSRFQLLRLSPFCLLISSIITASSVIPFNLPSLYSISYFMANCLPIFFTYCLANVSGASIPVMKLPGYKHSHQIFFLQVKTNMPAN